MGHVRLRGRFGGVTKKGPDSLIYENAAPRRRLELAETDGQRLEALVRASP